MIDQLIHLKFFAVMALVGCCVGHLSAASRDQPNILLILTDDQGYGDLSVYGNQHTETPHLESFAAEAVVFKNFHSQPVCSPTRAELMTGKWFLEAGVWGVHGGRDYLNLEQPTIANHLATAGYNTAMIGKWHLGKTPAYLPYHRGFEESWSSTDRLYEHTDPFFDHSGETIQIKGWTPEIISDLAIDYIQRQRDKPFFLYVAYPEVHEPWYAPDELVEKYQKKGLSKSLATVFAMNEQLDSCVGKLLKKVDELELERNTVVIYVGDNGPIFATSNGLPNLTDEEMALRNPESLRGCKGNLYENGTRVPGMIRWVGKFKPREVTNAADVVDLVPTMLEIAGVDLAPHTELRGQSLVPMLNEIDDSELTRPMVYANHETIWQDRDRLYSFLRSKNQIDLTESHLAIRNGQYKLIQAYSKRELFDIKNDPQESRDLSSEFPEIYEQMCYQLDETFSNIFATEGSYDLPTFPVGVAGSESTFLYACAPKRLFGAVQTNSHTANNLRQIGDGLEWEIDVQTEGIYQFALKLELGESTGKATLSLDNDETLISLANDSKLDVTSKHLEKKRYRVRLVISDSNDAEKNVINQLEGVDVILIKSK